MLSAAWIVEMIAGEGRAPVFEYPYQLSVGDMWQGHVFHHIGKAQTINRGMQDDADIV